jgi:hypothetical protein
MMAADFFHKIRSLATDLAAADAPLHDDEILAYLLAGLPAGYDPFITSMTTLPTTPTLDDVFAHLVAFEARQLRHHTELQLNLGASASFAGRGGSRGGRGRFGPNRGCGRGASNRSGGASSRGGGRGNGNRPTCQICGKLGHTAIRCCYRMDDSYHEEIPSAALASTSSHKVDPNWYNDTGATDHITSDLDHLAVCECYNGGE